MSPREPYKGYVIQADPVRRGRRWAARVVIELHEDSSVHYQEVPDDPYVTYEDRAEAERASLRLGRAILDSRPGPPHLEGARPA